MRRDTHVETPSRWGKTHFKFHEGLALELLNEGLSSFPVTNVVDDDRCHCLSFTWDTSAGQGINLRIVPARVVHWRREPYDVYIGRPSPWGNPFSHREGTQARYRVDSRAEAVTRYEDYIRASPGLLRLLPTLRGKRLGCWCAPKACHGDVLVKLLAEYESGRLEIPSDPDAEVWAEILDTTVS